MGAEAEGAAGDSFTAGAERYGIALRDGERKVGEGLEEFGAAGSGAERIARWGTAPSPERMEAISAGGLR